MNQFTMLMPSTLPEALATQSRQDIALPTIKAGGIDLLDHLKEGLIEPKFINNIVSINDPSMRLIDGHTIGALVTLTEIHESPIIQKSARVIAQAAGAAATPQIRNVATAGGNLLQRPRCWYYRNEQFDCLKKGGDMCYAVNGENKYHAIFGDGPCHIVHPSNLAPALMACNGSVVLKTADKGAQSGEREVRLADFFRMPDVSLHAENIIGPQEVLTHIRYQPVSHSAHYEIREKQSFDWPLVMVAVAADMTGGKIRNAKVCAGAVAPIPWQLPRVADALEGVAVEDDNGIRRAASSAALGAKPMTDNAYKMRLLEVAVFRAVVLAAGRKIDDLFHPEAGA